jgi:pimeloyl-ACP methyl ester carboxylesterase
MSAPLAHETPALQSNRTGQGPRVALVGGGLTGWASWEPHQQRLAASRDVVRLQPLSVQYGLEDRELPAGYSVRMESRALAAALDRIGWSAPIDLVAWSFGGLVSLDFALDNPDRIRTLTLIEPPAFWVLSAAEREDPRVAELAALLRSLEGEITEAQLERFARGAGLVPPGAAVEALSQWPAWVEHRRSLRNSSAPLDHDDSLERLERFDRPVLLVTGSGTPWLFRRIIESLAENLPNARMIELPSGHAPQLVSIDAFLEEMSSFHEAPAAE